MMKLLWVVLLAFILLAEAKHFHQKKIRGTHHRLVRKHFQKTHHKVKGSDSWSALWDSVKGLTEFPTEKVAEIDKQIAEHEPEKPVPETVPEGSTPAPSEPDNKPAAEFVELGSTVQIKGRSRLTTKTTNTFEVELSAKSYIRPVSTCQNICGTIDIACMAVAPLFCASLDVMGVVSNSESYGRAGNHRLYSKVTFSLTCGEDGKVSEITAGARDSHVGVEGPLQPPDGEFDQVINRVENGVGILGYRFSGRPHNAAEPTFQALKFRSCRWIWHFPLYQITSCTPGEGSVEWSGTRQLGGSFFPTHRMWRDGVEKATVEQGDISALWDAQSSWDGLVAGRWPSGY